MVKLFLEESCWDAILSLPRDIQNKFKEFRKKFIENPKSPAIHLESIADFKDGSLRTARLGLAYRVIIGVVDGDTYCVLHVDHHDEAMAWARNKKFIWNDKVDSFQVISVNFVTEQVHAEAATAQSAAAFAKYSDEQLMRIGVPQENMPLVRQINSLDDLDKYEGELPPDAWENLYYLMDSGDIDRLTNEVEEGRRKEAEREEQLRSENNRRRFVDITEDEDLDRLLNADLKQWMIFLHPSQRRIVEGNYSGSLKVSGGGGTGKTVAAIHRLKLLCTTMYEGSGKILYTAFNRPLIDNLKETVRLMDVPSQRYTLETVDSLVWQIANENKLTEGRKILYDNNTDSLKEVRDIWQDVEAGSTTEFTAEFLMNEYQEVILYNDVTSLEQYFTTPRVGQGNALSRKQRRGVWEMVERFRTLEEERKVITQRELYNLTTRWLKGQPDFRFSHVIADEIQDLSTPELRFLRALTPQGANDLFLVGDPYQRIYPRKLNFKAAGINIQGRSRRLRVNYRTTEEIKRQAVNIVSGFSADDFNGGEESLKGYVSLLHGEAPAYELFANKTQENEAIGQYIRTCLDAGFAPRDICVAASRNRIVDDIAGYLSHEAGIACWKAGTGDKDGVRLTTFHSMKGLEFRVVILADVSAATIPSIPKEAQQDYEARQLAEQEQRSLMYVALTRAINRVLITGCGEPSTFLLNLYKPRQ